MHEKRDKSPSWFGWLVGDIRMKGTGLEIPGSLEDPFRRAVSFYDLPRRVPAKLRVDRGILHFLVYGC